jgi:hypothetical protein
MQYDRRDYDEMRLLLLGVAVRVLWKRMPRYADHFRELHV